MASEYNHDTWDDLYKYIKRKGTNRTDEKIEKSRRYVKSFVSIFYFIFTTFKNIYNVLIHIFSYLMLPRKSMKIIMNYQIVIHYLTMN